jgi:hypothetical protein
MLLELKLAVYTFGAIPDCRDALATSLGYAAMLTEKETPPVRAALVKKSDQAQR